MSPHSPPDEAPSWFVVQITALASLGGCLFGYDMGAISGALPQLQQTFDLTQSQQEWVVSILYLGGGFGACIGGTICDWLGRQRTIVGTDVCFVLGAAWLYWSNSYEHVLIGRFVVGIAVAVSGVADVSYLHEIAPLDWRGSIVSVNEACISLGFLLAYVAGVVYSNGDEEEWRSIFGWAGVLALIQMVGMCRMPESPVWLAGKGRTEESRLAWQRINGATMVQSSLHGSPVAKTVEDMNPDEDVNADGTLELSYQHTDIQPKESRSFAPRSLWKQMIDTCQWTMEVMSSMFYTVSRYRCQVYVALFLAITQQLCGQTNVLNYAPHIFAEAAGRDDPPAWSMLAIGFVKFTVTVLVIWKIEYVGRRLLLLLGMSLISLGLLGLIVAFGESGSNDPDSWSTNLKTFDLALPGVLLVVCGYSMSFGPLTWLLTSELFPTEIRGRALGGSTIATYLCASLVTRTFLSASSMLGPSIVFGIYCVVTIMGVIFAYLAIPDTGGKTVKQVEDDLHRMWWWRFGSVVLSQTEESNQAPNSIAQVPETTQKRIPEIS